MWEEAFNRVKGYIVLIESGKTRGTGFLFAYNDNQDLAAVATAAHVVQEADRVHSQIRIRHDVSSTEIILNRSDRVIEIDSRRDTASVVIVNPGIFPRSVLPLANPLNPAPIGSAIAWAGFPKITWPRLCLFSGTVASFVGEQNSYWVDGVAISGVSGGPVFMGFQDVRLIGSVSAYQPNLLPGALLPGMLHAQDLSPLQSAIHRMRSIDEVRRQLGRV